MTGKKNSRQTEFIHYLFVCVYVCVSMLPAEELMDLLLDCSHRLVPAVTAALNWNYLHTKAHTHAKILHIIAISVCASAFVFVLVLGRAGVLPLGGNFKALWKDGWTQRQQKHQRGWDNWTGSKCCIYAFISSCLWVQHQMLHFHLIIDAVAVIIYWSDKKTYDTLIYIVQSLV